MPHVPDERRRAKARWRADPGLAQIFAKRRYIGALGGEAALVEAGGHNGTRSACNRRDDGRCSVGANRFGRANTEDRDQV